VGVWEAGSEGRGLRGNSQQRDQLLSNKNLGEGGCLMDQIVNGQWKWC